MKLLGPAALCRLDDALVEAIRRGRDDGAIVASAAVTVALGAGSYGVALGVWRGKLQALYSAVKLPSLFFAVALVTVGIATMLALLSRARLGLARTTVATSLSLAVTAAVLGAMAPIAVLFACVAPSPDPSIVGLALHDPRVLPSLVVARTLVVFHVVVVAGAGMAGVIRLRGLLGRLGLAPRVARRVLVSWMATQLLAGSQLSWLMRPFFGRPHLKETLSCDGLLESNFFEELAVSAVSAFGPFAPVLALVGALVVVGVLVAALRPRAERVTVAARDTGLVVDGTRHVAWSAIRSIVAAGAEVHIELRADESFVRDVLTVTCTNEHGARATAATLEAERARVRQGPFRTSAA